MSEHDSTTALLHVIMECCLIKLSWWSSLINLSWWSSTKQVYCTSGRGLAFILLPPTQAGRLMLPEAVKGYTSERAGCLLLEPVVTDCQAS